MLGGVPAAGAVEGCGHSGAVGDDFVVREGEFSLDVAGYPQSPVCGFDSVRVVVDPGRSGETVAGEAGGGVGAGETSFAAGEFESGGGEFDHLPEGKTGDGKAAGAEKVTSLGPEDGAKGPALGEGMAEKEGREGDGDVDVPTDAAESLELERAGVAPGEGEADGEGQQQHDGEGGVGNGG